MFGGEVMRREELKRKGIKMLTGLMVPNLIRDMFIVEADFDCFTFILDSLILTGDMLCTSVDVRNQYILCFS